MEGALGSSFAYVVLAVASIVLAKRLYQSRSLVKSIPGPPSPSWLFGHSPLLLLEEPYGKFEFKWQEKYGTVYRTKGCLGEDRLVISDPTALRHILGNPTTFVKSRQQQLINHNGLGESSLLAVEGSTHKRLRAVMNPAFSASSIRTLSPVLEKAARELSARWEALAAIDDFKSAVNVYPTLHDTTLQAVGEAVMAYDFNADVAFAKRYHNLVMIASARSKALVLADGMLPYIPSTLVKFLIKTAPPPALRQLVEHRKATNALAETLLKTKIDVLNCGEEPEKDLFSIIVGANSVTANRMTYEEILDQFGTVTLAGEDTTANSLAWAFYELAKHPEWQETLRIEIGTALAQGQGHEIADYDRLPFLNALLKEVLRIYATVPQTERVAAEDSVIPLSAPIKTVEGRLISEIPVKKGQHVIIAISSYNRLPSVWGADAHEFKPSRWLSGEMAAKGASLGPYSNLLSFLGGPHTCIGWRFSLAEMQIIVTEMVQKFRFSLPSDVAIHPSYAITLVPMSTSSDPNARPTLPLILSRLE